MAKLLDLPPEIRLIIYGYLFKRYVYPTATRSRDRRLKRLAIMQTCRLIYEESKDVFKKSASIRLYERNVWDIPVKMWYLEDSVQTLHVTYLLNKDEVGQYRTVFPALRTIIDSHPSTALEQQNLSLKQLWELLHGEKDEEILNSYDEFWLSSTIKTARAAQKLSPPLDIILNYQMPLSVELASGHQKGSLETYKLYRLLLNVLDQNNYQRQINMNYWQAEREADEDWVSAEHVVFLDKGISRPTLYHTRRRITRVLCNSDEKEIREKVEEELKDLEVLSEALWVASCDAKDKRTET